MNRIDPASFINPDEATLLAARQRILSMYNTLLTDDDVRAAFEENELADLIQSLRNVKDRLYDNVHLNYYILHFNRLIPDHTYVDAAMDRLRAAGLGLEWKASSFKYLTDSYLKQLVREYLDGVDLKTKYPDAFLVIMWLVRGNFLQAVEQARRDDYERFNRGSQ